MSERWCHISVPGYEAFYEVSDQGRLRSSVDRHGTRAGHVLVGGIDKDGYRVFALCCNQKRKSVRLATLVLRAFVGPVPKGMEPNHKNGIKADNRLINLEYVTKSINILHSRRELGQCVGSRHGAALIDESRVFEIKRAMLSGQRNVDIAKRFRVGLCTVSAIRTGRQWRHVKAGAK